ncbi:MAG: acetyl-CoA carboxylase carboxyltransferase subunit beta [Clostridiales bacterium]|nr:acetyl-CoA carboxylase carboxyltransferase subunit beta [Clostridiales bacterium]
MKFKKPSNTLEGQTKKPIEEDARDSDFYPCPGCKKNILKSELRKNLNVCPLCSHHLKLSARRRIAIISDPGSFTETDQELTSDNLLQFPEYDEKLALARLESSENEAVITGFCEVGGHRTAIFAMEPRFMMGSMGRVVGEKITRLFEAATAARLPVVSFTVSGGARMQEGILSLMQMAKTSGAAGRHSEGGNLFLCVLTDPTTGGVTANFAMQGDIIIAEPGALICFTGPRVIEQTIRKKLPEGFQKAEFQLEKGFLDDIVDRRKQRDYIIKILKMHAKGGAAV